MQHAAIQNAVNPAADRDTFETTMMLRFVVEEMKLITRRNVLLNSGWGKDVELAKCSWCGGLRASERNTNKKNVMAQKE